MFAFGLTRSEKRGKKSFYYLGGICEGTETAAVLILFCVMPKHFDIISVVFAIMCWLTTFGRVYTLSILLLGCVGCIRSPPSCIIYALRGIRSFAALPKSKLVRVYSAWSNFVEKARAVTFVSSLNVYKEQAEEIKSQAQ